MASNNVAVVLVASLFILFFWASSANAQPVFGGLDVAGELCCTANLTCPGAPLSGAVMKLNCTDISGVTGTVAQTVTDADGAFNMSVPPEAGLLLRPPLSLSSLDIPCILSVGEDTLAATTDHCSFVSDSEILMAPLQAVGGLISTPTGLVQSAVDGPFSANLDFGS